MSADSLGGEMRGAEEGVGSGSASTGVGSTGGSDVGSGSSGVDSTAEGVSSSTRSSEVEETGAGGGGVLVSSPRGEGASTADAEGAADAEDGDEGVEEAIGGASDLDKPGTSESALAHRRGGSSWTLGRWWAVLSSSARVRSQPAPARQTSRADQGLPTDIPWAG